jgi:hypothetical protein
MSDNNPKKNSKHRQIDERKQEKKPSFDKHDAIESNTGTIQKRKSNFKNIKPISLKNSSEIDGTFFFLALYVSFPFSAVCYSSPHTHLIGFLIIETSNLIKFKNSHLGKSAPCK